MPPRATAPPSVPVSTEPRARRLVRTTLVVGAVVAGVHLVSQLTGPTVLTEVSQWLLMPLLAVVVLAATRAPRSRLVHLLLLALGLSWWGDTVPDLVPAGASFLTMVGLFLLAQVAFVVAFVPSARRSPVWRRPVLVLPYAAALTVLVVLCAPGAGSLLVPVVVYGTTLTAAAVLSTGVHRLAGLGGGLFLVSDALIAVEAFADLALPAHGLWVMATYIAAQGLIAAGVLAADRDPAQRDVTRRAAVGRQTALGGPTDRGATERGAAQPTA